MNEDGSLDEHCRVSTKELCSLQDIILKCVNSWEIFADALQHTHNLGKLVEMINTGIIKIVILKAFVALKFVPIHLFIHCRSVVILLYFKYVLS